MKPATLRAGGSTKGRNALTGNELELVITAAHRALLDYAPKNDVSPCKVAKMVRQFAKHLKRSGMTFGVFLSNRGNQRWMQGDPVMNLVWEWAFDPTGNKAARNVDRDRERRRLSQTTQCDMGDE